MTVAKPGSAEYFRRLGVFDTTMIVIGVASAIWSNPRNAMLGVFLIAAGIPPFLFWRRRNLSPASPSAP